MPRVGYITKNFNSASKKLIASALAIIEEYRKDNLDLTLRQLYYQLVARDILENKQKNYDRLGRLVSDARMAGIIDWYTIVDRTRFLRGTVHTDNPEAAIEDAARSYYIDKWKDQERRVEVWVEKDALVSVIERACAPLDIDFFACRGYVSQSAQWRAAQRLIGYRNAGQDPVIVHLGDHDPSGIDMSRDILERIALFMEHHGAEQAEVNRIALNMDQVRRYKPPPNPAKETDSRSGDYIAKYGHKSWELDALEPKVLIKLITDTVLEYRDEKLWREMLSKEKKERQSLEDISNHYPAVVDFVAKLEEEGH